MDCLPWHFLAWDHVFLDKKGIPFWCLWNSQYFLPHRKDLLNYFLVHVIAFGSQPFPVSFRTHFTCLYWLLETCNNLQTRLIFIGSWEMSKKVVQSKSQFCCELQLTDSKQVDSSYKFIIERKKCWFRLRMF